MDGGDLVKRSTMLAASAATLAGTVTWPARIGAQAAIPVRFALIGSGGQDEVPSVIQQFGLDKKYGLALELIDFTAPGQQYPMFRADAIDVSAGNFVDLLRQRKAGVRLRAFRGFQGYSNLIVTKPDSAIKTFRDLRGKKVGEFGTTFLDWLIVRAAGEESVRPRPRKRCRTGARRAAAAEPVLGEGRRRGDPAVQQSESRTARAGSAAHRQRAARLDEVGRFRSELFLSPVASVSEKWANTNPGAIDRVNAMIGDAYAKLKSDDSVWPALAGKIHVTDPASIAAYRDLDRKIDDPPYSRPLIAATQKLLDAIVAIAGADAVGVTAVDPAAFLFPGRVGK